MINAACFVESSKSQPLHSIAYFPTNRVMYLLQNWHAVMHTAQEHYSRNTIITFRTGGKLSKKNGKQTSKLFLSNRRNVQRRLCFRLINYRLRNERENLWVSRSYKLSQLWEKCGNVASRKALSSAITTSVKPAVRLLFSIDELSLPASSRQNRHFRSRRSIE